MIIKTTVSKIIKEDLSLTWSAIKGMKERVATLSSLVEVDVQDGCCSSPFKRGQYIKLKPTSTQLIIDDVIYDVSSKSWVAITPWRYATRFDQTVRLTANEYGFDKIEISS